MNYLKQLFYRLLLKLFYKEKTTHIGIDSNGYSYVLSGINLKVIEKTKDYVVLEQMVDTQDGIKKLRQIVYHDLKEFN